MPLTALNQVFEKVYVLTLPRLHERHAGVKDQLQGLHFTWFYGVDKADTSLEELTSSGLYSPTKTAQNHRYHKTLALGMVCCALGHRMMYAEVIKENLTSALILEDDAIWTGTKPLLNAALSNLPPDWDVLYFGYEKNERSGFLGGLKQAWYHFLHAIGKLKWKHTIIKNLYAKPYNTHWKRAGFHDCTHAYAVSQNAAKKLLALQTPVGFTSDNVIAFACTSGLLKGYVACNKVFDQLTAFTNSGQSLTET